jgi:hypothetical protein
MSDYGLMDNDDWAQMRADLAAARADNLVTIAILNRPAAPPTQTVRIVGMGGQGSRKQSDEAGEARGGVLVKGDRGLDIQEGDEFFHEGQRYRVRFVDPQRIARMSAEAEALQ